MRDDHKIALKKLKQQINALCLRNGRQYTLGPVSGRLLAELMTGQQPFTDPSPYSVQRFL